MRSLLIKTIYCFLVVVIPDLLPANTAPVGNKMPQRLPADTYFYFSIPDFEQAAEQWSNPFMQQLLDDPDVEILKQNFIDEFSKHFQPDQSATDFSLASMIKIPSGEVTLSILKGEENRVGAVFTMEYRDGESSQLLQQLLGVASDKLVKAGAARSIKRFQGTICRCYSLENSRSELDTTPISREVVFFLKDNTLVVSNDFKILGAVLSAWEGDHPNSLAAQKEYQYIFNKCVDENQPSACQWYFNPVDAIQFAINSYSRSEPMLAMVQGALPSLGITNIKAIGGSVVFFTADYQMIAKTLTYVKLPGFGLIDVFHLPPISQQPSAWVSNECISYYSMNWDLDKTFQAVEALYDGFKLSPGAFSKAVENFSLLDDSPKINFKKDYFDHFTGRVQIVNYAPELDSIEYLYDRYRYTFAWDLNNQDAIQKSLLTLMDGKESGVTSRDFKGTTIYEYENRFVLAGFCIKNKTLYISSNAKDLEKVIANTPEEDSLPHNQTFKNLTKSYPEKTSTLWYQRTDTRWKRHPQHVLRKREKNSDIREPSEKDKVLARSTLKVLKYLPVLGGYSIPDDHGFFSVWYAVTEQQSIEAKPAK